MLVIKNRFHHTKPALYIAIGIITFISTIALLRGVYTSDTSDDVSYNSSQTHLASSSQKGTVASTVPQSSNGGQPSPKVTDRNSTDTTETTPSRQSAEKLSSNEKPTVAARPTAGPETSSTEPATSSTEQPDNNPSLLGPILKPIGNILESLL